MAVNRPCQAIPFEAQAGQPLRHMQSPINERSMVSSPATIELRVKNSRRHLVAKAAIPPYPHQLLTAIRGRELGPSELSRQLAPFPFKNARCRRWVSRFDSDVLSCPAIPEENMVTTLVVRAFRRTPRRASSHYQAAKLCGQENSPWAVKIFGRRT